MAGHFANLDFFRPFRNAIAPVMAVHMFKWFMARLANAAMHLHGTVSRLADQPIGAIITHGDFIRQIKRDFRFRHCVHLRRRFIDQIAYHLAFSVQFGQWELYRLIGGQRLAERARSLA